MKIGLRWDQAVKIQEWKGKGDNCAFANTTKTQEIVLTQKLALYRRIHYNKKRMACSKKETRKENIMIRLGINEIK